MTHPSADPAPAPEAPAELVESIEISAPPAQVWAVVSDLGRMSDRSPQVWRTFVRGGPVRLGTRAVNINRRGPLFWPTRSRVVRCEPHREIAFQILDNRTVWSFELSETDRGTRVLHRRATPYGISPVSRGFTKVLLGGSERFTVELREGMQRTLTRVKAEAEAA